MTMEIDEEDRMEVDEDGDIIRDSSGTITQGSSSSESASSRSAMEDSSSSVDSSVSDDQGHADESPSGDTDADKGKKTKALRKMANASQSGSAETTATATATETTTAKAQAKRKPKPFPYTLCNPPTASQNVILPIPYQGKEFTLSQAIMVMNAVTKENEKLILQLYYQQLKGNYNASGIALLKKIDANVKEISNIHTIVSQHAQELFGNESQKKEPSS